MRVGKEKNAISESDSEKVESNTIVTKPTHGHSVVDSISSSRLIGV